MFGQENTYKCFHFKRKKSYVVVLCPLQRVEYEQTKAFLAGCGVPEFANGQSIDLEYSLPTFSWVSGYSKAEINRFLAEFCESWDFGCFKIIELDQNHINEVGTHLEKGVEALRLRRFMWDDFLRTASIADLYYSWSMAAADEQEYYEYLRSRAATRLPSFKTAGSS